MKSVVDRLTEVIFNESSRQNAVGDILALRKLISDMKNAGLLKQPNYTFPLVDTIGRTYYSSINKRN